MPPPYERGHVRAPNKDFLQRLGAAKHRALQAALVAQAPPPAWDSRTRGWIGPIKNQASCGSCWDFSGTCVVEVAYYKAGVLPSDGSAALSEEYTLSCGRNGGCNGDDNVTVLQWAKNTGLPSSADYGPYAARPGQCKWKSGMKLYKVDDWGFVDGQQGDGVTDTTAIKNAIVQYGCVGCAVAANSSWDSWSSDPNYVHKGNSRSIDHDVVLVGWDDAKGAWIMRNSWDLGWANQGYGWIAYGADSIGTESVWAVINAAAPPIEWYW